MAGSLVLSGGSVTYYPWSRLNSGPSSTSFGCVKTQHMRVFCSGVVEAPPAPSVLTLGERHPHPVSFVAGASRGIGLELTRQLLVKNPESPVIAGCRNPDAAENLLHLKDEYPSRLTVVRLDVTEESTSQEIAREIGTKYGRLDICINTVGVVHIPDVLLPETSLKQVKPENVMLSYRINAIGPAIVAKHVMPLLKIGCGEGTSRGGAVLAHLTSKLASIKLNKIGGWFSYRASKTGLNSLTRNIGVECMRCRDPVIVVLLHPGTVDTDHSKPFQRDVPPEHMLTPAHSAEKLLEVIDSLNLDDCGKFFAYDRTELPW